MGSAKDHLTHLGSVPIFSACTQRELQRIAKAGSEVTMKAGSIIIDQGQTGREAFVVLSGTVTVRRNNRKIATLGPGSIVGELSLLDHGPRTATVTCDTDCDLFVLDQRHFTAVLDDVPAIGTKVLAHLAGVVRELDRQYFG
ncbi:MAG: cyclic nucleotide-binding domain-containing protein [Actinomycetota bacterium]|jgi:CRP/FNR family cyclic AMP-dependent transcriptional regulator|nr:cyclic nucleotide-binding domain-containing protein [Actinomycetota bacterium]MDA3015244.1 cyclic nucleotide-binding domain-containing protein [Actinomycetota bacterium]MDA3027241.1 cyclic nucleotide-binding domain-containing protein [Actinomycetota bacterium]